MAPTAIPARSSRGWRSRAGCGRSWPGAAALRWRRWPCRLASTIACSRWRIPPRWMPHWLRCRWCCTAPARSRTPRDSLAAHLKRRLPSATSLALAFQALGRVSRGTATTAVENLARGGMVRRAGKLVAVPADYKTRVIDLGRGPVTASTIPWGDVSTAFHSTGIPNIEVYTVLSATTRRLMAATGYLRPVLGSYAAQRLLKRLVRAQPPGPND